MTEELIRETTRRVPVALLLLSRVKSSDLPQVIVATGVMNDRRLVTIAVVVRRRPDRLVLTVVDQIVRPQQKQLIPVANRRRSMMNIGMNLRVGFGTTKQNRNQRLDRHRDP